MRYQRGLRADTDRSGRHRRFLRFALMTTVAVVMACSATPRGPAVGPAVRAELSWSDGPIRWLLLPQERRELAAAASRSAVNEFAERFWARRGPAAASRFAARVADADRLYSDGVVPGSLTDRGRALIVLGPPSHLRSERRSAPAWDPRRPSSGPVKAVSTTHLRLEIWGYGESDLPPSLARSLQLEDGRRAELQFQIRADGVFLLSNERLLELAAKAWVIGD